MYNPETKLLREMEVGTIDAGYRRLLKLLEIEGYKLKEIIPLNFRRYIIAKGTPENIMILYKRDVFYNFGIMPNLRQQGAKGIGDSINVDDLKTAMQHEVKRAYIIYHTGAVYTITLNEFLEKSIRWKNKEGKEVRSISIHEYTRKYVL